MPSKESRIWDPNAPADHALTGIVVTNLVAIGISLFTGGGLLSLLWPYWIQSLVIGFYARRRLALLERFSTQGFQINDQNVDPTPATARRVASFFVLHYGIFHAAYFVFLMVFSTEQRLADGGFTLSSLFWTAVITVGFVLSHGASHREHVEADLRGTPNIGTLMFLPYLRIVPMHITIIVGMTMTSGTGVLLFGSLKTLADVVMHKVEHRLLQAGAKTNENRTI